MSALVRLALRALGAPSAVRPRLGGIFENDTGGGDAGGADAAPPAAAPQSRVVPVINLTTPAPTPGEASPSGRPAAPASGPLAPASVLVPDHAAPIAAGRPGLERPSPSGPAQSLESQTPGAPAPNGPSPSARRLTFTSEIVEVPARRGPLADAADAALPSTATPRETYRPLLPPAVARGAPMAPLTAHGEPADRGEPDIQISIGRIEVRGEPQSRRPPNATRAGAQMMSLEDYLAKGRRR